MPADHLLDTSEELPYNEMDVEVRKLVYLLNHFPNIKTIASCAGHTIDEAGYITIEAETQEDIGNLINMLPFWGPRAGITNNLPWSQHIWATVMPNKTGRPHYVLQFSGHPFYKQRELIIEIEQTLKSHLPHRIDMRPLCSKHETLYNEDSQQSYQ